MKENTVYLELKNPTASLLACVIRQENINADIWIAILANVDVNQHAQSGFERTTPLPKAGCLNHLAKNPHLPAM